MLKIEAERQARRIEAEAYYEGMAQQETPAGVLTYLEADESWTLTYFEAGENLTLDARPITRAEAVEALALAEAEPAD